MTFVAYEFLCACNAGLMLEGQEEDGRPSWMGKGANWVRYGQNIQRFETSGSLSASPSTE